MVSHVSYEQSKTGNGSRVYGKKWNRREIFMKAILLKLVGWVSFVGLSTPAMHWNHLGILMCSFGWSRGISGEVLQVILICSQGRESPPTVLCRLIFRRFCLSGLPSTFFFSLLVLFFWHFVRMEQTKWIFLGGWDYRCLNFLRILSRIFQIFPIFRVYFSYNQKTC